jgi:FkbM family methyltransferase
MNILRRMTYRPEILAVARTLHLTQFLRNCYYWSSGRNGCTTKLRVNGIAAEFYARTPEQLRCIEYNALVGEHLFLRFLSTALRAGDVFFDVGSNIGLFSVLIAKIVGYKGKVIAFEPQKEFFKNLEENIAINHLPNVQVFRTALGETNSTGRLYALGLDCPSLVRGPGPEDGSVESRSVKTPTTLAEWNAEDVEIVSGDWIRESQSLPVPRAVKIDVEGFEYSVLRGLEKTLSDPACQLLCCEIHPSFLPAGVTIEKILHFVKGLGFTAVETPARLSQLHLIASKA